jgi:hypothetical protein
MALRYYRNGPARALAFPLANGTDTAITVDSASGFPSQFPYTIIIEPDTATEEVCDVTAAVGNVLTITRGVDSTTATSHGAGSTVYHGVSARDMREANEHVNATVNVHGRTGSLVDTDSVQSIPGRKIFDDLETTGGGDVVTVGASQTITGAKAFSVLPTVTGNGDVATTGGTQTFTGSKTFANTITNGTETHNGGEVHNGNETHAGTVTFSGDTSVDGANLNGSWGSFVPVRHNGVGGATLGNGNGTLVGFFKRIGKTISFRILFTFGSTSAIGTSDYAFTLPTSVAEFHQCGAAILGDASAGKFFAKVWHGTGGQEIVIVAENGDRVSGAGGGSPIPWATGDTIAMSGSYEAA